MKALARYGKAFGGYRMIEVPEPECGPEDIIIDSNFAHRFCLCTLKIQYLAVIQLSKVCCYAA